ncbi:type II secretion system protein [Candidatus Saganbacteria bacterium]|nr:type II secretion system protein [Candidatus Saganbacteria bacterium]
MRKTGFSLVELIIAVVVIGIAFYALISVFITVAPRNVNVEDITKATHLAFEKMEETTVKPFTSVASVSATSFTGDFSNFQYQVIMNYVTSSEPDVLAPGATSYKRVKVRTWGGLSGTVELVTLVTTYEF